LYVSPRPPAEAFSRYYRDSESARYWASTFYRETAEARREKLWKPKSRMVHDLLGDGAHTLLDIGGGYGIFAEEYRRLSGRPVTVIEPGPALADVCRGRGLAVVERFLEAVQPADLPPGPRAFVSFELFEHLHDPEAFCRHLFGLMAPGDRFLFTTLSGTGADIQALWQDSKSVSPPHHLNFLNPRSVRLLLERVGFEVVRVTTPGQLDVDILANAREAIKDRFWRTFVAQADEGQRSAMQAFLAAHGLSSHMMVLCQRG
jgi:SAM-dependent methyltransferase